jgi:hypothetical protein
LPVAATVLRTPPHIRTPTWSADPVERVRKADLGSGPSSPRSAARHIPVVPAPTTGAAAVANPALVQHEPASAGARHAKHAHATIRASDQFAAFASVKTEALRPSSLVGTALARNSASLGGSSAAATTMGGAVSSVVAANSKHMERRVIAAGASSGTSRLEQMAALARKSRAAKETAQVDQVIRAFQNEELATMVIDAMPAGADGLWCRSKPGPFRGAAHPGRSGSLSRAAPRIKVPNGSTVRGTCPSSSPGWLRLSGFMSGYWLPLVVGGTPVLREVASSQQVQLGVWKQTQRARAGVHQNTLQQEAQQVAAAAAQAAEQRRLRREAEARTKARSDLDREAHGEAVWHEMEVAAIRIQSVVRGRRARASLAQKEEMSRRERERRYAEHDTREDCPGANGKVALAPEEDVGVMPPPAVGLPSPSPLVPPP